MIDLPRLIHRLRRREPGWIEQADLQRHLAAHLPVVLIDVRQPEEFTSPPGHLPQAINIPLADLPNRVGELVTHKPLLVMVCKTDRRSLQAARTLFAAGRRDVVVLRGGTDGWHQRGLALE